jgi:intracellular multiplication protein IcmL
MAGQQHITGAPGVVENIGYYRSALQRSQKTNIILSAVLAFCIVACGLLVFIRPKPVYFGMTESMQMLPITPLSEPLMNDAALKAWLAGAITDSFNLDFLDWKERLSSARQYFSKDAFAGFATTLESEGHLASIKQFRAIMHLIPTGAPIIINSGILIGIMTWDMEMPVLINYETSNKRISSQHVVVRCRVQRMPTTDYVRGVAIVQLVTAANHGKR